MSKTFNIIKERLKREINSLKEKGLIFIDDIEDAKGKTVIRAHGIRKEIYDLANKKGIELKDYTCPNVLKIHKIAEEYAGKGFFIFLCGSKEHPENIGTISYCGKNVYVIEKEDNVEEALEILKNSNINKLLIISQTTYSLEKFNEIEKRVKSKLPKNIELIYLNDKLVGFYNGKNKDDNTFEIANICVMPEYQNNGIGTVVLKEILFENNDKDIILQCFKENLAIKLFERVGFGKTMETETHYIMKKSGNNKFQK